MKLLYSYKLITSKEIEEKCKRLGLKEFGTSDKEGTVIFISNEDNTYFKRHIAMYNQCEHKYREITQEEFLALPEPLKVGDWVGHTFDRIIGDYTFYVFEAIPVINISEDGEYINQDGKVYLPIKNCTKLTPEQIKILGLEAQ